MKTALSDDQFRQELGSYERSAFRLELQRAYAVGNERDLFDAFLAGRPEPPITREEFRAYYRQTRKKISAGVRVERVRLTDNPPTDYQRWTRYMDRWNIQAGEVIHYLPRSRAKAVGLTEAFGGRDWWLLDDHRLILMGFDDKGAATASDLTTDDSELQQARSWRDLAITTARGEN